MIYAHCFAMLCFVMVMLLVLSRYTWFEFAHILQGCFTGTGAILWLPQCQWSNPEEYGHIYMGLFSQYLTTTRHHQAWDMCIIYGMYSVYFLWHSDHNVGNEWKKYVQTYLSPLLVGVPFFNPVYGRMYYFISIIKVLWAFVINCGLYFLKSFFVRSLWLTNLFHSRCLISLWKIANVVHHGTSWFHGIAVCFTAVLHCHNIIVLL